jgi:hypothetical protein
MGRERVLTVTAVLLMSASLLIYSVRITSNHAHGGLPIFEGIITAIVVAWFVGFTIFRRSKKR